MFPLFCPRDLPSFEEICALADEVPGVEPTAILTAMRTLEVADALVTAMESYLQSQFGLSTGRFSLLMILYRHRGVELTPSDLAERAAVTRATVTGLLDGLETGGLVARRAHTRDRRRVSLRLTPAGEKYVEELIPQQTPRISAVAARLSERERRRFLRLLDKVEAGLEVFRAPGSAPREKAKETLTA